MRSLEVPPVEVTYLHRLGGLQNEEVEAALGELALPYYEELAQARRVQATEPYRPPNAYPLGDRADTAASDIVSRWDELLGIEPTGNLWTRFHNPYGDPVTMDQPHMDELECLYSFFWVKCRTVSQAQWDHVVLRRFMTSEMLTRRVALSAIRTDWICNLYMTEAKTRLRLLGATASELSRLCA